jgi:hypothetical protein
MGAWQSVTINISGEGDIYRGYFRRDNANLIREFYDYGTNPRSNVLLGNEFHDSDNLWSPGDSNFTTGGVDLSSIPYLDASVGGMEYNVYYEGGSNLIFYSNDGGYGTIGTDASGNPSDANKVTCTFSDLPEGIWIDAAISLGVGNMYRTFFRIDASDPPVVQEFYSYDNPDLNVLGPPGFYDGNNQFYPFGSPFENANFSEGGLVLTSIPLLDNQGGYVVYNLYYDTSSTLWVGVSRDGSNAFDIMSGVPVVFSTLPGRPYFPQTTFKARRPMSSSELLALQRTKIEKTLTIPPSINIQDSSEVTARIRKGASVLKTVSLPGQPTKGNSGNMVKFNDSSVVQAMLEGNAYRAAACNYQPRQQRLSWLRGTIPDDQITYPKAIVSAYQISNAAPRVVGFNPVLEFGWRKNDNKAVIFNVPLYASATFSYLQYHDAVVTCGETIAFITFSMFVDLPNSETVTSLEVVGHPDGTWESGEGGYGIDIPGIALPRAGEPDLVFPITVLINGGKYTASGSVTITDHAGLPPSTVQTYGLHTTPTDPAVGSLFFPDPSGGFGYMCAGSNSDFYVPENTPFTIMWWQYLTGVQDSNDYGRFARPFNLTNSYADETGCSIEGTGSTRTIYFRTNGNGIGTTRTVSDVTDGWHHIAITRQAGNNFVRVYFDGDYGDTINGNGSAFGSSNAPFILGMRYGTSDVRETFTGWITQFVFDNGFARYTGNFTPPTSVTADPDYTVLLLNTSGLLLAGKDDSGRNHDLQFYGNRASTTPGFSPPSLSP